jgi:hypothetical protein
MPQSFSELRELENQAVSRECMQVSTLGSYRARVSKGTSVMTSHDFPAFLLRSVDATIFFELRNNQKN